MSEKAKHNETIEGQWFSADRPVRMRERDRLGRRQFAEAIAKAVGAWRGQDSLVRALWPLGYRKVFHQKHGDRSDKGEQRQSCHHC